MLLLPVRSPWPPGHCRIQMDRISKYALVEIFFFFFSKAEVYICLQVPLHWISGSDDGCVDAKLLLAMRELIWLNCRIQLLRVKKNSKVGSPVSQGITVYYFSQ